MSEIQFLGKSKQSCFSNDSCILHIFWTKHPIFSNLELIMAQQTSTSYSWKCFSSPVLMKLCIRLEICLSSRFMSIVLRPEMTPLVPFYLKMHVVGEGPGATLSVLRCFFYLISSLLTGIKHLAKNYQGGTLSVPFWCLCQKLSLSLFIL